jgi:hypothetical protein
MGDLPGRTPMTHDADPKEIPRLAMELAELAGRAPGRLRERVAGLSVRQQAELALRLPAAARLELLLHAPQPMRLVRSLPDSEFYMTVREIGPADALPLVHLASASQLHHLLDLEGWNRDRFDANRAGAWVALLVEAGGPALRRFLRSADDELLALLCRSWIGAQPVVPDGEPDVGGAGLTETGDETGLISPDGCYRFVPSIQEHAAAIRHVAQVFFRDDPERYSRILWSSLYELPSALEEEALRWRQSRLEEHGFPPWDEALAVYAPPAGPLPPPVPREPADPDALAAPRIALRLPAVGDLIRGALEALSGEARDGVLHQLVGLANHLLVADGADTRDPEQHRGALAKAAGYVTVALEARGAGRPAEVQRALSEVSLIELFREGHGRAADLQRDSRDLMARGWASRQPDGLRLLDGPLLARIEALLEPRPLYVETRDGATARRAFRSLAEIDETRVAVEVAEVVGRVLIERLGTADGADPAPPSLSAALLTLLAWHATRGDLRRDPLPADVASDFVRNVASRRTAAPDAPGRALDALVPALARRLDLAPREAALLGAYGRACLERLAAECSNLDPGVPLDHGVVRCLSIRGV